MRSAFIEEFLSQGGGRASLFNRVMRMPVARERPLEFFESFVDPMALIASVWGLALHFEGELSNPYFILGFVLFAMTFPGPSYLRMPWKRMIWRLLLGWAMIAGLLLLFAQTAHLLQHFDRDVVRHWLWLAPLTMLAGHGGLRLLAPWLLTVHGETRAAIIVGCNDQGLALAARIASHRYSGMRVVGFVDDRGPERLQDKPANAVVGALADLPRIVREKDIGVIFLSLPMTTQPRILKLLDELRDTTASIYFVPDFFVTDLIQGRMDAVADIPVVAVCESPFTGLNGMIKRVSDLVLASLILLLLSPMMLAIALGVKLSSPGPVIFMQRRYGLDGREILVYKFRSMTVCEDGPVVRQAQRQDKRITPLGAILRKTSLDELPQFINVLQGRMSIVGPRPHAVAHNEMYRKLIKGYMVRHKVKPGITGWAQVNGLRGETETLDKMQARIEHDLDYLRNWSLRLDLQIILRTVLVVVQDRHAY